MNSLAAGSSADSFPPGKVSCCYERISIAEAKNSFV